MNAADVVRFLKEHPDFLSSHGEIFADITVPHPHGGQAITLAERQLHALRDKIRLLEGKLAELIRYGEENDEIGEKVHQLGLALLEAGDFTAARNALFQSLRDDFSVPHVAMRLWSGVPVQEADEFAPVGEGVRELASAMQQPYCGTPGQLEVLEWFGGSASHLRSVALVPLRRDAELHGLLVLASEEGQRFYPEMGTLYLSRIGDIATAALRRLRG